MEMRHYCCSMWPCVVVLINESRTYRLQSEGYRHTRQNFVAVSATSQCSVHHHQGRLVIPTDCAPYHYGTSTKRNCVHASILIRVTRFGRTAHALSPINVMDTKSTFVREDYVAPLTDSTPLSMLKRLLQSCCPMFRRKWRTAERSETLQASGSKSSCNCCH